MAGLKPSSSVEVLPTRRQALVFASKAWVLRGHRRLFGPRGRRFQQQDAEPSLPLLSESRSALYSSADPAEFALQAGKVQNLRVAARYLDGLLIPAGETFSFWAHVPRPTRSRRFTDGREIREGCVIPAVGGGLCQLSNALHDAALQAALEVVERHAHTRRLPGAMAADGRDAVVFWNYVDLRFRPEHTLRIEVRVEATELVVRFRGAAGGRTITARHPLPAPAVPDAESCETCGRAQCFRNPAAASLARESATAWLVDTYQPEFDAWMSRTHREGDSLILPLESRRWNFGPYRWHTDRFSEVRTAPGTVLHRSIVSRRLAAQGAPRQRALLAMDEAMAGAFARKVPATATHLVVSQNLLPFLWRAGELGGRTFDVLMTRLPLDELHRVLDQAASAHPTSRTLADFRAPAWIVEAESEALAAARHWVTPHSAIARLACSRAVRLPWQMPEARANHSEPGTWIVFPASTLARKGALELREVARHLALPIRVAGPCLEEPNFWDGVNAERCGPDWSDGARLVVLPAWVEHSPRRLLQAVAAGIPVIASDACGLEGVSGVVSVPRGDARALAAAIEAQLATT